MGKIFCNLQYHLNSSKTDKDYTVLPQRYDSLCYYGTIFSLMQPHNKKKEKPCWLNQFLIQICPTRCPVEGFVRHSWGVRCSENILSTDCPYFHDLQFEILMEVVLSATLSRLLPLQLGLEHFLYISFSPI